MFMRWTKKFLDYLCLDEMEALFDFNEEDDAEHARRHSDFVVGLWQELQR